MPARANQPTRGHSQDGSDTPRTPARRVSQAQTPVTPVNKTSRRVLAYPSPSLTPPPRSILNAALSPPATSRSREEPASSRPRAFFSGLGSPNTPASGSRAIKQEPVVNPLATPPTTPLRSRPSTRSTTFPDFIPAQGAFSIQANRSPNESPSSSRTVPPQLDPAAEAANIINRRLSSQSRPRLSGATPATFGSRPPIKKEDLEFDVLDDLPQSVTPPSSSQPQPQVQGRAQARPAQAQAAEERPFFEHDGATGIFRNGQRLRPFQAADLHLLVAREQGETVCGTDTVNNVGYVVAYDMGCGKTATSIALIVRNPPPDGFEGARATLVVVPTKGIMDHWLAEVKKFSPHLKLLLKISDVDTYTVLDVDIVLCTYTQLQRQHEAFVPNAEAETDHTKAEKYWPLFQHDWYRVITDEAHQFRNPSTKTADAVWAIKKQHALCLTGTPAQNSYLDYYPLLKFLGVTYEKLHDRLVFERKIYSKRQKGKITDPVAQHMLSVVHGSFFIFRNKSDDITGDGTPLVPLPPREDHVIDVKLTYWERAVYQYIRGLKLSNFAQITRLRQVCDHPVLVSEIIEGSILGNEDGKEYEERCAIFSTATSGIFRKEYQSSRICAMSKILAERQAREKTIIFTHFTRLIPIVTTALVRANICWTEYSGDMDAKLRKQALQQIKEDDECTVIIISIKAGGTGLNITACNSVILMDPWWNPFFEEQAISRVHRIGQEKPVNVYHLVVENSIEEHIMETQEIKRKMIKHGEGEVKFEANAKLDEATMRSWLL